jgi:glycosyltransferase involved in cell wall biosynthesis
VSITKHPTAIICLSPNNGGMEIDSIKLTKKLSPYTKIVLIAKKGSYIASQSFDSTSNILLEPVSFKTNFSFNIIFTVRKLIEQYKIKNIIFFGASELRSLYFSFINLNINLIIRHGTTKSKQKQDLFHKIIYSQVKYHVSICKHLENNVKYIIPFHKRSKSKLIYSSLDNKHINFKIKHDKLSLLHVGRIANAKGQFDAIKACEIFIKQNIDFELNLVGGFEQEYQKEFMNFYNNCPYKNKINLIGFTTAVDKYYTQADIFLFPSHGEGLSNAFLEALSYNLICISYNNTSFPELKELGFHFYMAQNKNIINLQKILLNVASNINQELLLSQKNTTVIKNFFSIQREVAQYLEILE